MVVVPNIWEITRDEEPLSDDTMEYTFGFGRRICPGRTLADAIDMPSVVSVLPTMKVGKAKDANGVEIGIDPNAFEDAVISAPEPFVCSIIDLPELKISFAMQSIISVQMLDAGRSKRLRHTFRY
ncbi:hypothetical protein AX14_013056 [Amanita brunnescens Koide BX004]|nr:hypothetical protein AX14_013056 [Amanita brunnescens Koide BX004]